MASSRYDTDKENAHTQLPKDPLPTLPKYLFQDKTVTKQEVLRPGPLKTINTQTTTKAGPSNIVQHTPITYSINIDTKDVTMKQRKEHLDCHNTAFNDKNEKDDNAIRSDEGKNKNALGAALSAVTPLQAVLELPAAPKTAPKTAPPVVATQEKTDDKVKRCLSFNDSVQEQDTLRTPDIWKRSYMLSLKSNYTKEVFEYLLAKERKQLQRPRTSNIKRACVINWFIKVNGPDGNPAIVQTACWYFDSVVGSVLVDKPLLLVGAACFWIAQKLKGVRMTIPAKKLVKYSNSAFTTDELVAAERAVMLRLNFPTQPIVPQEYITYLSWWCDTRNAGEIEVAATFLAMCGLLAERLLCVEYPSAIAVAAVENALLLLGKKELLPRLQMTTIFIAAEKKASNLSSLCSILRRAVHTVAAPYYKYKAPLEHYSMPPCCIAQRIIRAANKLTVTDARNCGGS